MNEGDGKSSGHLDEKMTELTRELGEHVAFVAKAEEAMAAALQKGAITQQEYTALCAKTSAVTSLLYQFGDSWRSDMAGKRMIVRSAVETLRKALRGFPHIQIDMPARES